MRSLTTMFSDAVRRLRPEVPDDLRDDFSRNVLETNLSRLKPLSVFMALLAVYFLIADFTMVPAERMAFARRWYRPMDMALPLLAALCIYLSHWAGRLSSNRRLARRAVMYLVPGIFAFWFAAVAGLELHSSGASATIVALLFGLAAVVLFRPSTYLVYATGALAVFAAASRLPGQIPETPFEMFMVIPGAIVMSTLLSAILWAGRAEAFVDRSRLRTTAERLKAEVASRREAQSELEGTMRELEDEVRTRTAELKRLNGLLEEAGDKHRNSETRRKRLERQLRQAQRLESIGRLAGGVAHDFNNLLSPIIAYTDLMLADEALRKQAGTSLKRIRSAGEQAARLTRQLLAFSRSQVLTLKPEQLEAVLREMAPMLQRLIGERYRLEMEAEEDIPAAMVDASMVQQVVLNLVVNARDAMSDGGTIRIALGTTTLQGGAGSAAGPGIYVTLAVSDSGVGMDMQTVDRIYEPFFTTKEEGKGTGLGLAMVHGIVKQHGGAIELETTPGRGTTFTVLFPATSLSPEEGEGNGVQTDGLRGSERILVVEDEEVVRDLVEEILRSAGYTVHSADSPDEALRLSREISRPIHLLLSDVVMPGMEGFELYRRLRKSRRRTRALFMSGYSYEASGGRRLPVEDALFISKPFTARELLQRVREAL